MFIPREQVVAKGDRTVALLEFKVHREMEINSQINKVPSGWTDDCEGNN